MPDWGDTVVKILPNGGTQEGKLIGWFKTIQGQTGYVAQTREGEKFLWEEKK